MEAPYVTQKKQSSLFVFEPALTLLDAPHRVTADRGLTMAISPDSR
jgi:glycerol kinase